MKLANISLVFVVVKSNEDPWVKGHRASRMLAGTTMPAGMTDLMQESDYVVFNAGSKLKAMPVDANAKDALNDYLFKKNKVVEGLKAPSYPSYSVYICDWGNNIKDSEIADFFSFESFSLYTSQPSEIDIEDLNIGELYEMIHQGGLDGNIYVVSKMYEREFNLKVIIIKLCSRLHEENICVHLEESFKFQHIVMLGEHRRWRGPYNMAEEFFKRNGSRAGRKAATTLKPPPPATYMHTPPPKPAASETTTAREREDTKLMKYNFEEFGKETGAKKVVDLIETTNDDLMASVMETEEIAEVATTATAKKKNKKQTTKADDAAPQKTTRVGRTTRAPVRK